MRWAESPPERGFKESTPLVDRGDEAFNDKTPAIVPNRSWSKVRAVVLGASDDLRAAFPGPPVIATYIESSAQIEVFSHAGIDVIVVDERNWESCNAREAILLAGFAHIPVLLVSNAKVQGPFYEFADDVTSRPIDAFALSRSLRVLGSWAGCAAIRAAPAWRNRNFSRRFWKTFRSVSSPWTPKEESALPTRLRS